MNYHWLGERHSWTLRYRKVRGDTSWWVKGDRYATTAATDPRFGGAALHVTDIEGDYS